MMLCQECNQMPATLHFTKFINGEKNEIHICEKCAQEMGEVYINQAGQGFSFNNLLSGLLNIEPIFQSSTASAKPKTEELRCKRCNLSFKEFVQVGKFGCEDCYKTFDNQLNPILKRVHSGNTAHIGKIPNRMGDTIHLRKQVAQLKEVLKDLIEKEEFEKAAEIRDEIRSLEKQNDRHVDGGPQS